MADLVSVIGRAGLAGLAPTALSGVADSRARRMMLAGQKLIEPSRSLYEHLYLKGEQPDVVMVRMGWSAQEFDQRRATLLRTLMSASQ